MATKKGKGPAPAPLDPKVTKKLLDLLSTDNAFRRLFKKDAHAALTQAGWKPPIGPPFPPPGPPATVPPPSQCLQLKATDRIAPKAKIVRDRAKLEQALNSVVNFFCAKGFSAD